MRWAIGILSATILASALSAEEKLSFTREEDLLRQLAEAQMALTRCEAEGSAAAQSAQAYQRTVGVLLKSLDARGLTLDAQGTIVKQGEKK